MFAVGFGNKNREEKIREIARLDHNTAVVLAAVHFEWMLKRAILKLGMSPTSNLRKQLEDVYKIRSAGNRKTFKSIWEREVGKRFKNSALGSVLGSLSKIQTDALDVRGTVIHGNGTVSRKKAVEAIDLFLAAGEKLRGFTNTHAEDLDSKLRRRMKARSSK